MNQSELTALRDALARTTPGAWLIDTSIPASKVPEIIALTMTGGARTRLVCRTLLPGGSKGFTEARANAKFITLAHTLVPELLAEAERLTALTAGESEAQR